MNEDWYIRLKNEVERAGFFVGNRMREVGWERTVVCSRKDAQGNLTGNSFWIASVKGSLYLGTWGVRTYRLREPSCAGDLCVDYLKRVPRPTMPDVDDMAREKFALEPISPEEFDRLIAT